MKDALNQELFPGDLIAFVTAKKTRIGIVKNKVAEGVPIKVIVPTFSIANRHDPQRRVWVAVTTPKLMYKNLRASEIIKVSRDVIGNCDPNYSPVWNLPTFTEEDKHRHRQRYIQMFTWLFQFYPLPKLKLPPELKNL